MVLNLNAFIRRLNSARHFGNIRCMYRFKLFKYMITTNLAIEYNKFCSRLRKSLFTLSWLKFLQPRNKSYSLFLSVKFRCFYISLSKRKHTQSLSHTHTHTLLSRDSILLFCPCFATGSSSSFALAWQLTNSENLSLFLTSQRLLSRRCWKRILFFPSILTKKKYFIFL